MDIFIDDNISRDQFYISVPLNEIEFLSFDWTIKGHRIILQRVLKEEPVPAARPTMEWDTIYISKGKFIGKEHTIWYDMGQRDWVNGKIYETVQEWSFNKATAKELLRYSLLIRDHTAELGKYVQEMEEFEKLLDKLKQKYVK